MVGEQEVVEDAVGVAQLVEEIIDSDEDNCWSPFGKMDPSAVRFKNLRQFCDKAVFESWLTHYSRLPEDGDVVK